MAVNRTGCTGPSAFRVHLTWTSVPSSDLDLHLLRPGGSFFTSNDCYSGNCTSGGLKWGATGAAGDPILDVDDTYAYGPEDLYLNTGAEAGQARIVVHTSDGTIGEVATITIFFNDVEAVRYTSQSLDATPRRYWEVAKVDVTQRIITTVGNYSSTAPATLGGAPAGVSVAK